MSLYWLDNNLILRFGERERKMTVDNILFMSDVKGDEEDLDAIVNAEPDDDDDDDDDDEDLDEIAQNDPEAKE